MCFSIMLAAGGAGTVVDGDICHPTEFDFYLLSHAGIQGALPPRASCLNAVDDAQAAAYQHVRSHSLLLMLMLTSMRLLLRQAPPARPSTTC